MFARLFVYISLAGLVGCAAGPKVDSIPSRQIDRGYVLPEGAYSWTALLIAARAQDDISNRGFLIPHPFIWEMPLAKSWSVVFSPVPLTFRQEIVKNGVHLIGAQYSIGLGYSTTSGAIISPAIEFLFRRYLSDKWAWDVSPGATYTKYGKFAGKDSTKFSLKTGPIFQLDDQQAIAPQLSLEYVRTDDATGLNPDNGDFSQPATQRTVFGAGVTYANRLSPQWEAFGTYAFGGIGFERSYRAHLLMLGLNHFW